MLKTKKNNQPMSASLTAREHFITAPFDA